MNALKDHDDRQDRLKREVVAGDDTSLVRQRPNAPVSNLTVRRELVTLAWPIATAMLGETAIGLVDTKLVGGLGSAALGGVGLATTLMFLAYAFIFGLMRGVKVATAHAEGLRRAGDGFAYARAGVVMGAALGLGVLVLCRDASPLLRAIGADPTIIPYARDFLAAVTWGAPALCALAPLIQYRQAIGDARTPMIVSISGNVFNAVFAWAFIYGHFGLPALGARGGGYATAITKVLELSIMLGLLVRLERRGDRATLAVGKAMKEVVALGGPMGLQFFAEMLAFAAFTAVLGSLGRAEIAAHQIALSVIRVSFLPGIAIAEAASVLVGRALGARNLPLADRITQHALETAIAFMALCGASFAVFGGIIARFFSDDPEVFVIAKKLLLVAALFQVLDAVNIVFRGALRGAKDVKVVAAIGIFIVWTCVPTAAWVLGRQLGMGALGGWIGFVGETVLAAALFRMRWKRGAWRNQY